MNHIRRNAHRESSSTPGFIGNPFAKRRWSRLDDAEKKRPFSKRTASNNEFGTTARNEAFQDSKAPLREVKHADTAPAGLNSAETSPTSPSHKTPHELTSTAETSSTTPIQHTATNVTTTQSTDETTLYPNPQVKEEKKLSPSPTQTLPEKKRGLLPSFLQRHGRKGVDDVEKGSNEAQERRHFGFWPQMEAIFYSPINVLLVLAPVGIGLGAANANGYAVFIINFVAIMPLAGLLSFATEELAIVVGDTFGGLLNASFGNAVELIVSIIALAQKQIVIVQTSLIGSMLSNLLLVLGMCFFAGGINREKQNFNVQVAQTSASLLSIAVASLIIPTTFYWWGLPATDTTTDGKAAGPTEREHQVPKLSRGIAVILLVVYACYLFFQLKTHRHIFRQVGAKEPTRKASKEISHGEMRKSIVLLGGGLGATGSAHGQRDQVQAQIEKTKQPDVNDEEEERKISVIAAVVTLIGATAFIGACSEYMVRGIQFVVQQGGVSPEFIGLILIPIVGNAAEHATAVTVAIKDKMDLAIGVAIGSSLQISLFVLPAVVIVGWGLGDVNMTLQFDGFLIALLFVSMLLVNYLIQDGSSHWLEGVQLMLLYVMIAVAAWFYPQTEAVVG